VTFLSYLFVNVHREIGNDNQDACKSSPASAEKAITVAASTLADERAYFSNYGTCVNVFAPGLNILSTYTGSPNAIATLSGTSMASPHVAGLVAYLLSIYPSVTFHPPLATSFVPTALNVEDTYASFYSIARVTLPYWISQYLPAPDFFSPIPKSNGPILSPAELRSAIEFLSTPNIIADSGKGTPNLLVFNNATA
jgi:cerevisin